MTRARTVWAAAALMAAAAPVQAQQPAPAEERIGYIVAMVGDSAVLNFDVQEGILSYEAMTRQPLPASGPERDRVVREIIESRINELLILQAALRDTTIQVPDQQVARRVEDQIRQDQRRAGGRPELERALRESGMSLADYRDRLTVQMRKQAIMEQYRARMTRERKPPPATEEEIRQAFAEFGSEFGSRPATITFDQVVVRTEPSVEALAAAKARADSVYERLRAGEDFADLARRFSDDATRTTGGDLGWFRRSTMVRDFANVAFSLRPGQISPPVLTRFGYHIIKVERARGAEINARHILFRPALSDEDAVQARARADTVAGRLRAGDDPRELASRYGDRDAPVRVGPAEVDSVQASVGVDLSDADRGDVIGPVPLGGRDVASEFMVARVREREAARPWTLDDAAVRERIRQQVEFQKMLDEIVGELRRSTYIEIRDF